MIDCRLRSEPWSIVLEKVYIVVGPQTFKDYDPFKEEQLELEVKLSALDGIESEWRALNENGGGGNGGATRRRLGDRDGDEYYPRCQPQPPVFPKLSEKHLLKRLVQKLSQNLPQNLTYCRVFFNKIGKTD